MRRRTMTRRNLLGRAAGLATATLLPMPAIAETRQVKFTLSWLATASFAFVYAANVKGFMQKRGIDMSIARGFGSFATAQSIAAGTFDFGLSAVPAVALSVAKGLPLISLATTDYDAKMGVGVPDASPIKKPQDLAGKKIASVPTSGEFPFLPAYAKKVGLDWSTVESVHVDNKVLERVLEEKQVDAITNFASTSYATLLVKGIPTRWFLYSAAGIKNHGLTIIATKDTLAKDPALCEAVVDGLLEGSAFALTNPNDTLELFLKQLPELALNPNAKQLAQLELGLWQHSVDHPEPQANGLGWCDPAAFTETTDLCMTYLATPDMKRPDNDQLFTNRFTGKIKLDQAQWAQVRQDVSEFDKVFG
jgi:ABC-type nitrate/sulfonate/bicarbonate transport system substrate-binding protein